MGKIVARPETGRLFFDFRYRGIRCREQTMLPDTPDNKKRLKKILANIEAEITLGTFDYTKYFPGSNQVAIFGKSHLLNSKHEIPKFSDFSALWLAEMKIQWRKTQYENVSTVIAKYLTPYFGKKRVNVISKMEIMNFRSTLALIPGRKADTLSPSRINHILTPLRMILNEAANRYDFSSPYNGIKSLKVPRTDVQPFNMKEVNQIINNVRVDFRNYYLVRFLTGMRTSEIDGLKWQCVDFERRQILVHKALVAGEMVNTKNDGSYREIDMSTPVYDALQEQNKATGKFEFVFCTIKGTHLNPNNVTQRVWYPLLNHLELKSRRPYQTRHTAATLWLASGESPEWIARQMGHTTTEMLFRVYSRYVPNLTRKDGSAFERLIKNNF